MLKQVVDTVPTGLEEHYEKKDGKFVLKVEGFDWAEVDKWKVDAAKLPEFRENNNTFKRERDDWKTKYESIQTDPNGAVNAALKPLQERLKAIEDERDNLRRQNEASLLGDAVRGEATKAKAAESAIVDIVTRAGSIFEVKDGKVVAKADAPRDSSGNAYTVDSWMKSLAKDAKHLFVPSSGAGAPRERTRTTNTTEATESSITKISRGLESLAKPGTQSKTA